MRKVIFMLVFCLSGLAAASGAIARTDAYGPSITLETAKKVAAQAAEVAKKNQYRVAIAIVDTGGHLVYFEKLDDTQIASVEVAIAKARSANNYKRETRIFQDGVAAGRTALLGLAGAVPLEGGIPLVKDGRIIGAIGVSGVTSEQDGQVASAGARSLSE